MATRSVIYTSADGMEKVTLSVDQYRSPEEAAAAFQQAVETSRGVPGFHPFLPAPGIGQQSFAGTVTMGQETHIGMGALDGNLVVGVTLAGFDASPDNQARLANLSAQEDAAARAALGAAPMTHDDAYIVPQDHVLTAPAAHSVLFNDHNATLASGPAHGSLQLADDGSFSWARLSNGSTVSTVGSMAGSRTCRTPRLPGSSGVGCPRLSGPPTTQARPPSALRSLDAFAEAFLSQGAAMVAPP